MDDAERQVRIEAMRLLTIIVVVAIVGITVTAVTTDRDVRYAEGLTFAGTLALAVIGGLTLRGVRRRHRWRIEHDDTNGT